MEQHLVMSKAILQRVITKYQTPLIKDTRHMKVLILLVFRQGCSCHVCFSFICVVRIISADQVARQCDVMGCNVATLCRSQNHVCVVYEDNH